MGEQGVRCGTVVDGRKEQTSDEGGRRERRRKMREEAGLDG
jgi:hypothetical protein